MTYTKPNLPDPGHDRWWVIIEEDGVFELQLRKDDGSVYNAGNIVASERIYDDRTLTAARFETTARDLLDRIDKRAAFVGTYHKN